MVKDEMLLDDANVNYVQMNHDDFFTVALKK